MAWCRYATNHYLNQCWPRYMSPWGFIRPQWVKIIFEYFYSMLSPRKTSPHGTGCWLRNTIPVDTSASVWVKHQQTWRPYNRHIVDKKNNHPMEPYLMEPSRGVLWPILLVQLMGCCHQATRHYLSLCWLRSMSPDGVTRSQWIKHKILFLYQ